ncbi:restriction endonuclease subunit S [bacterium]|nr:restriction endonuclease subunit S [bacterium]
MSNTNFVRYDAYKDSGVGWLGAVPAHWDICRLKELSNIQNSNVDKKSHEGETHVQLCNYVDVYKNEFINASLNFMWATADESEIKRFRIKKNDVLITKDSETCDDIAIPALVTESLDGVLCGYHLAQFRTKDNILLGSYLFRLFQSKSYGFRFVISAKGITRVGLGQSAIADSLTPVPPLLEQIAIAAYLDTKTAHIDRKIDLLSQKAAQYCKFKQSLINETVTRGLDKTVAMKDSGIDWIGEVPKHWRILRAKDIFRKVNRLPQNDDQIVTAFRDGHVTLRKNRRTAGFTNALKEHGYQRILPEDLVIHAMDGFAGAIGVSDSTGKSSPVYSAYVPVNREEIHTQYFGYWCREMALTGFISSLGKGIRERSTEFRHKEFAHLKL